MIKAECMMPGSFHQWPRRGPPARGRHSTSQRPLPLRSFIRQNCTWIRQICKIITAVCIFHTSTFSRPRRWDSWRSGEVKHVRHSSMERDQIADALNIYIAIVIRYYSSSVYPTFGRTRILWSVHQFFDKITNIHIGRLLYVLTMSEAVTTRRRIFLFQQISG